MGIPEHIAACKAVLHSPWSFFCVCIAQVVVFDLEFGQPAGSTPLPGSRPAFSGILGCYGHAAVGPGTKQGGVDLLYCSHQASSAATPKVEQY